VIRARLLAAGLASIAAVGLAACGGGSPAASKTNAGPSAANASPTPIGAAGPGSCLTVPEALDQAILRHVVLAGAKFVKVRAAKATSAPGYYYVTGSMAGAGASHLLATWATRDLGGRKPIYAVDSNAALISAYGASTGLSLDLGITAPGALHSRTCVAGKSATAGLPAPAGGHGAPAGQ
jgi:hypothetical protein